MKHFRQLLLLGSAAVLLSVCSFSLAAAKADTPGSTTSSDSDIDTATSPTPERNVDPYEKFNRSMFTFNDKLDQWILHPVAKGYDNITPSPIRRCITNFFSNLDTLTTIPNDLLQGKTAYFVADTWRFMINSTVGIGGLLDIASLAGLPKHHEDFGLTLAYWSGDYGLKPQPYLVLPFLGSKRTTCKAIKLIIHSLSCLIRLRKNRLH